MTSIARAWWFLCLLCLVAGCDEIARGLGGGPSSVVVSDARGLGPGGQVRVHGVNVGRVAAVSVVDEGARIELELTSAVALHAGACASVRTAGLAGEAYLHLDPGEGETPLEGELTACEEPTLEGATAASLAELTGLIEDLRRYVGTLERGERALCTVTSAAATSAAGGAEATASDGAEGGEPLRVPAALAPVPGSDGSPSAQGETTTAP